VSKAGQITIWVVAAFLAALAIAVLLVLADLDGIGKGTIESYGSAATAATVNVEAVDISLRSHEAAIHGLQIGNPQGFGTDYSLQFDAISIELNVDASTDDVVFVDRLVVDGARVIAECRVDMKSNLGVIFDNVMRYAKPPSSYQAGNLPVRIVIQEFEFSGGELRVVDEQSDLDETILVPGFALTGIGRQDGGATIAEVRNQLLQPILQRMLEASVCLDCYLPRAARIKPITQ